MKTVILGDTIYLMDAAYRRGVRDFSAGVPYLCNPFRFGSNRYWQWTYGHSHASEK